VPMAALCLRAIVVTVERCFAASVLTMEVSMTQRSRISLQRHRRAGGTGSNPDATSGSLYNKRSISNTCHMTSPDRGGQLGDWTDPLARTPANGCPSGMNPSRPFQPLGDRLAGKPPSDASTSTARR
jgi:hypothetical protein